MDDFCLKFDDRATADNALAAVGITVDDAAGWSLSRLGRVWAAPEAEGEPSVQQDGYHVNLRIRTGGLPTGLAPFRVTPSTPYRRFAE